VVNFSPFTTKGHKGSQRTFKRPRFWSYFCHLSFPVVPKLHNIFTTDVKLSIAMIMPHIVQ